MSCQRGYGGVELQLHKESAIGPVQLAYRSREGVSMPTTKAILRLRVEMRSSSSSSAGSADGSQWKC